MDTNFMMAQSRVEIPLSKVKIAFLLLASIVFVLGGLTFVLHPEEFQGSGLRHKPTWQILTLGYVCIVFFGAGMVIFIYQLFNKNPGLVITDQGITINPGTFSETLIPWDLISGFGIIKVSRTKLIAIYLKDPEAYIDTLNNTVKRRMASFNLKNYGTPISITANNLKCNTSQLNDLLTEKLKIAELGQ